MHPVTIISLFVLQAGRDKMYLIKRIKQGITMPVGANIAE